MGTKEKILNRAIKLFKQRGYSQVAINDICDEAQITKPTFYKYYKNKEDIIIHLFEDFTANIDKRIAEVILKKTYFEQISFCFNSLIRQTEEIGPDIISQMFRVNLDWDYGSYDFQEHFSKICIAITKRGQEAGEFRGDVRAIDLYKTISYAFTGYLVTWCIKNGDFLMIDALNTALKTIYLKNK